MLTPLLHHPLVHEQELQLGLQCARRVQSCSCANSLSIPLGSLPVSAQVGLKSDLQSCTAHMALRHTAGRRSAKSASAASFPVKPGSRSLKNSLQKARSQGATALAGPDQSPAAHEAQLREPRTPAAMMQHFHHQEQSRSSLVLSSRLSSWPHLHSAKLSLGQLAMGGGVLLNAKMAWPGVPLHHKGVCCLQFD